MAQEKQKLTLTQGEILLFGMGSLTSGLMMSVGNAYYSYFLTNIIFMSATDMGTIMFISRIVSALIIPVTSAMMQNVTIGSGKFGKYRTWILVTCPLCALFFALTFMVHDFGRIGNMVYYFTMYFISYCIFSLPQAATLTMMPRMGNQADNAALASRRALLTAIDTMIYSAITMPLVNKFGNGDQGKGYTIVVAIYAVLFIVGYYIGAFAAKKGDYFPGDVEVKKEVSKLSPKQQLSAFVSKAHILTFTSDCLKNIGYFFFTGTTTYYFRYVIENLNAVTLFLTVLNGCGVLAGFIIEPISKKMGVKNSNILAMSLMTGGELCAFFFGKSLVSFYIFACIFRFGYAFTSATGPMAVGYAADWHRLESGVDARAYMMAMYSMPIKIGAALTAGVVGWALGAAGMDATLAQQPAAVIMTTRCLETLIPGIVFGICDILYVLYPVTNAKAAEIKAELAKRDAAAAEAK